MRKPMGMVCILAVSGVVFGQGTRTPADGPDQGALLAEVRALRAEIHQVTSAGIRTQLLVARLQLQEQRVFTIARQLADAQNTLVAARFEITSEQARVRQLEDAASRATGPARAAFQQAILEAGAQMEQQQKQELQLQARETELLRAVSEAQVQWTDFNDRLNQLEQSLGVSVAHQP